MNRIRDTTGIIGVDFSRLSEEELLYVEKDYCVLLNFWNVYFIERKGDFKNEKNR